MGMLGRGALLCALVGALSWGIGEVAYAQERAVTTAASASAWAGPKLVEQAVRIPATDGSYSIAATILRPEGPGPFGAVVLNHGVPGTRAERLKESADLMIGAASVFARRGYVVVMPLRRGFGATGGEYAEDPGSCANPDYRRGESAAAEDALLAYNYARSLPYVDRSRMILAGQSAGAMVALYAAGSAPEGLVAVLGFAAGRGGNPSVRPGVPCAVEPVAKIFDQLGRTVRVPVMLHYAENDQYFNPQTTRLWYDRFTASGGQADYVMQPAFGRDGHYIFSDAVGQKVWEPAVQRFLASHGLPFDRLNPLDPARPILANERAPNSQQAAKPSMGTSAMGR